MMRPWPGGVGEGFSLLADRRTWMGWAIGARLRSLQGGVWIRLIAMKCAAHVTTTTTEVLSSARHAGTAFTVTALKLTCIACG